MARGCVFFALFAATLMLQGCHATSISDIIANVTADAQSVVEKAQDAVSELRQHVQTLASEELQTVQDEVANATSAVESDIQSAVAALEAQVGAVVTCSEAVPSEVQALLQNISDTAVACVTTEVDEAKDIIEDLLSEAEKVNATVNGLQSEIDACSSKILTAAACYAKVVYADLSAIASAATQVASDITKGAVLLGSFRSDVTTCEAEAAAAVPAKIAALIQTITSCYTGSASS